MKNASLKNQCPFLQISERIQFIIKSKIVRKL